MHKTFTLNPAMHLAPDLFEPGVRKAATREGWGQALASLGERDERVVALSADVSGSVCTHYFEKKFPARFVQCGIAEQNMASVAAGLAMSGMIPFFSAYGVFSPGRNWDQIRVSIAYNNLDVKFSGAHAGLTVGPDGATHQALEDLALMRVLPNVCVLCPSDEVQAAQAVRAAHARPGPVYIRLCREKTPVFHTEQTPFEIGRIQVLADGSDVAIMACGISVYEALMAARKLADAGISAAVLDCHTIKPLDGQTLAQYAKKCGAIVTAEEHQITGGLGGAVCEYLAQECPTPVERVGMPDRFGESGEGFQLLAKYGLDSVGIEKAVKKVMGKKRH